MRIIDVLTHLPEGVAHRRFLADPEAPVYTVSFIAPGAPPLRDDVLYFGDGSTLDQPELAETRANLVLYDVEEDAFDRLSPRFSDANIVLLADSASAHACYNALQALFLEDQAQIGIIRRMMLAHFSNKGIAYLVDEAAKALGNPIDVIDHAYHHIAYSMGSDADGGDGDHGQEARDVAAALEGDKLSDEQIDYISSQGIDSELARTAGPLVRYNHVVGRNTMTLAVMAGGACIAFVMLIELHHPFRKLDAGCFERFAGFVGQELQKSEMWQPAIGEMGSHFLTSLLGDASPSESSALRRVKELNFHPKRKLYVLCLHAPGEGLGQRQAERTAEHLRPFMGDYLYTRFHRNLVVLYTQEGDGGIDERALHLLRETAQLNELTVGISNPFDSLTGTRRAYDQARAAIRLGTAAVSRSAGAAAPASGDADVVFDYRDYAGFHLLEVASRRTDLADFCHPALLRLQEHDARHNTELMDTLYCFLLAAGSNARSAEMLNLHKNSMLYRMGRIAKIVGLDLSSGEDRFTLMTGFRILIYLGMFEPRVAR